jgi:hypothetical protein
VTSALDGGERLCSRPGYSIPDAYRIEFWVLSSRAGLEALRKTKFVFLQESNSDHPVRNLVTILTTLLEERSTNCVHRLASNCVMFWATGWMIGGFESRQVLGIFLLATASRPTLVPPPPASQQMGTTALSLRVKWPGHEADHSLPSSAEVKECVELYLHSPNIPSWSGAKLKKHSNKFTFLPFIINYIILYYITHNILCIIYIALSTFICCRLSSISCALFHLRQWIRN